MGNYFHAVFEASKSVAEKLRQKSGLGSDGSQLVDEALRIGRAGYPRLAFNTLTTESVRAVNTPVPWAVQFPPASTNPAIQ